MSPAELSGHVGFGKSERKERSERREEGSEPSRKYHPVHTVAFYPPAGLISKLPRGARLFLGRLPQQMTKDELASIFVQYGNIVEIVLKGVFGFIQFETHEECKEAADRENQRELHGSRIGTYCLDLKVT